MAGKLCCLNPRNGAFYQCAVFGPLLVADNPSQVLDLGEALADEYDQRYLGDPGQPGVADQLRVQSCEPFGSGRVGRRCGLPVDDRSPPIEKADGINITDVL